MRARLNYEIHNIIQLAIITCRTQWHDRTMLVHTYTHISVLPPSPAYIWGPSTLKRKF